MQRRELLRSGTLGVIGAVGAGLTAGTASAASLDAKDSARPTFDRTVDVLVVGSGFAGAAAALAATEAGAEVEIVEKMAFAGGNSALSGGMMAVPGSSVQKKQGIEDSPEKLVEDMQRIGMGLGDPELVRALCNEAADTFEWTRRHGVVWNENLTGKGGHSAKRCMVTKEGTGQGILKPFYAELARKGVRVRTKTFVSRILRDESEDATAGAVTGVELREGYVFGKPDSGKLVRVGVRRGIVLAYGGFAADKAYRRKLDPKLSDDLKTTNQPGATSEMWREASRIGARIIQADWIQCLPTCSPKEEGMGLATHFADIAGALYGCWVSTLTGARFASEFADRKVLTDAILGVIGKGGRALAVADANGVAEMEKVRPGLLKKVLASGVVTEHASPEALAKAYGMDPAAFEAGIRDYNALVRAGKDTAFGRPLEKAAKELALDRGPWYASVMSPKLHHCMGGVTVNAATEVLDVMTDRPIPGLYAAGECVGGIHGAVRIGACAVMDCLVNGRKAGAAAAARNA